MEQRKMILYIHGFGGSGEGSKARAFREYFKVKNEDFIAPSLSYIPELALKTLEELIALQKGKVTLIGSSLGGFYAIYLAQKYNLKAVLINPSIYPYITLSKCLGSAPSFYDASHFEWMESHIAMLKNYRTRLTKQSNFMLLLQKGDEVLNYKEAADKFSKANLIVEEGGDHSFVGIERHFQRVNAFFALGV
jgi:predicted esterase YcpF (UPF0227 family)